MQDFYIKKVSLLRKSKGTIALSCICRTELSKKDEYSAGTIQLIFYKNDIFRIKYSQNSGNKLLKNILCCEEDIEKQIEHKMKINNSKNTIDIRCGNLKVLINKDRFKISIFDRESNLVYQQNNSDVDNQNFVIPPMGFTKDNDEIVKTRETFQLNPGECIYGLGEKFMPINKSGKKLISWALDPMGNTSTDTTYKNIPFFISTQGYGIFINTGNKINYDFGATSSITSSFEVESKYLDYFFIYGPTFKNILFKYTGITGRSPIPPKWSFGIWMSRCMYETRKQAEEIVMKMKELKLPFDVIHLDPLWLKKRKYLTDSFCEFEWDEEAFPDPKGFIKWLHSKGIKISLWENPYIHKDLDSYKEGLKKKYFPTSTSFGKNYKPAMVETPNIKYVPEPYKKLTLIDFTNPEAVKWYKEKHMAILKMGADVFKPDYGEWAPVKAKYFNGMDGKEMHNLYPLLYCKTVFEATKEHNSKGIIWARSGYAGIQKYPLQWGGDAQTKFSSMSQQIRAGLSYGLSGVPFWSSDIGGFVGSTTKELYIRWLQFGMFCSNPRYHGTTPREPWHFDDETVKIFRKYAHLRYKLLPYIYSYAYESSKTGLPMMRPLVLEYQDDPNVYNLDLEYLFGRELLVAPIFNESNRRTIYLPEGNWIDFWSKKEYKGESNINYYAPLSIIPIFIKEDSIIVSGDEKEFIKDERENNLTLDIYCAKKAIFTFKDDYETINFTATRSKKHVILTSNQISAKNYTVNFNGIKSGKGLKLNGRTIKTEKLNNIISANFSVSGKFKLQLSC